MARVRVYFITNRNHVPANKAAVFGPRFNPDGVAALRFGHATFDVEAGQSPALVGEVFVHDDVRIFQASDAPPPAGSHAFFSDLQDEMRSGRDTLVFIHGFNVSFVDALRAGAALAASIPQDVNVVVFSWPSDGDCVPYMSYYSDREDARASGPALARAYLKLFDFIRELREAEVSKRLANGETAHGSDLCQRCIHVLAHSMGNYVLRQGVQAIRVKDQRKLVRMFDQVIMAAADEDDDAFELDDKLRILPTLARRITVYHNRYDRALVISDQTKANPDRLGSEGPRMMDLLPKKVILVDCSRISQSADVVVQHSYYINSRAIASDITAVLADQESIANREAIRPERAYRIIKDI